MSHLVEQMAFVGDVPWHGLGVRVNNDMSVKEMQKVSGADFRVEKIPEIIEYQGEKINTGNYALLRVNSDDSFSYLDSVSSEWQENQNDEAFEFFGEWVEEGNMEMHTAGVLDEGRMVWCLAKLKEGFSLFRGKDKIDSYLLFSNPHRYGMSITVMSTPIRVVCNNTLQFALGSGKKDMMIRIDHRKKFDADQVKQALDMNTMKLTKYKEALEMVASKKANKEKTIEYFAKVWPTISNKTERKYGKNVETALKWLDEQPGAKFGAGTWYHNFNTVTFVTDHLIGNNDNARVRSAFYGFGRNSKVQALNLAVEYAKAA